MSATLEPASPLRFGPVEGSTGGDLPAATAHSRTYPWAVRARACIGIAILVPFGVVAFFTEPWWTGDSWRELSWEILAWSLLIGGTVVRFWATAYIGGHKGKTLVCEGPYSLCRNPLYFGTFLITLSIPAFLHSLIFALGVAAASSVYLWTTVRAEEMVLRQRLGEEYAEYCRRVPRFWPKLWGIRTSPRIEVDVRSLRIEAFRALRWALIPLVVHLALNIQDLVG